MSPIDLSAVAQLDPGRRSAGARWRGTIRLSLRQLRHRLLESLLILLGIAVGVGVLTGMGGFLRFLSEFERESMYLQPELRAVTVRPRTFDMAELYGIDAAPAVPVGPAFINPIQLTSDDVLAARSQVAGAAEIIGGLSGSSSSPIITVDGRPLGAATGDSGASGSATAAPGAGFAGGVSGASSLWLRIERITPDEFAFRGRGFLAGRAFTWEEYAEGRLVLVLEQEGAERLFPGLDPAEVIGKTVSTRSLDPQQQGGGWQIVGVLAKEELSPLMQALRFGNEQEVVGYVPHTAGEREPYRLPQISFTPADPAATDLLIAEVEQFFALHYGPDSVTITDPSETLRELNRNQRSVTLTLMGLAALALLVAAINILNLFTARVIRRRRLAAMSVALGAERRSLFGVTLTEAILLGVGGSLLGMLPAYGVIALLRSLLLGSMAGAGPELRALINVTLTWPDVFLGLLTGVGTSLVFGLYPAYLSASVDPSEGLRRE